MTPPCLPSSAAASDDPLAALLGTSGSIRPPIGEVFDPNPPKAPAVLARRQQAWRRRALSAVEHVQVSLRTGITMPWTDQAALTRVVLDAHSNDTDAQRLAAWLGWWARDRPVFGNAMYVLLGSLLLVALGTHGRADAPMDAATRKMGSEMWWLTPTSTYISTARPNGRPPLVHHAEAARRATALLIGFTQGRPDLPDWTATITSNADVACITQMNRSLVMWTLGRTVHGDAVRDPRLNEAVRAWLLWMAATRQPFEETGDTTQEHIKKWRHAAVAALDKDLLAVTHLSSNDSSVPRRRL